MAPYIGKSKTLMTNLGEHVASSLVANGTLVEVPEGASAETIDAAWERKFGSPVIAVQESIAKAPAGVLEKPRGNASREDWVAYAVSQGTSEDDLAGLKQGEIRALFDQEPGEEITEAEAKAKSDAEAAEAAAKAKAEAEAAETEKQTPSGSDDE